MRRLEISILLVVVLSIPLTFLIKVPQKGVKAQGGMAQGATTASMGGTLLALNGCTNSTTTIPGIAPGMVVAWTPSVNPGAVTITPVVSVNTVTLYECAAGVSFTPPVAVFYLRVLP